MARLEAGRSGHPERPPPPSTLRPDPCPPHSWLGEQLEVQTHILPLETSPAGSTLLTVHLSLTFLQPSPKPPHLGGRWQAAVWGHRGLGEGSPDLSPPHPMQTGLPPGFWPDFAWSAWKRQGKWEEEGERGGGEKEYRGRGKVGEGRRKRLGEEPLPALICPLVRRGSVFAFPHLQAGLIVWGLGPIVWGREPHWQGINL